MVTKLEGVREYSEEMDVEIDVADNGRQIVRAFCEAGYNHTAIDLGDLLGWLAGPGAALIKPLGFTVAQTTPRQPSLVDRALDHFKLTVPIGARVALERGGLRDGAQTFILSIGGRPAAQFTEAEGVGAPNLQARDYVLDKCDKMVRGNVSVFEMTMLREAWPGTADLAQLLRAMLGAGFSVESLHPVQGGDGGIRVERIRKGPSTLHKSGSHP